MIICNLVVLFSYCAFIIAGKVKYKGYFVGICKKEHVLYFLYEGSLLFIRILSKSKRTVPNKKCQQLLKKLGINKELYWCKKITVALGTMVLINCFCILAQLGYNEQEVLKGGHYILRPSYGEGEEAVNLGVLIEDGVKRKKQEVEVTVQGQEYTEKVWKKVLKDAQKYLDKKVLGTNKTSDKVTESLDLINAIPGTGIKITWETDNKGIVDCNGKINQDLLHQEGEVISLRATMKCRERMADYVICLYIYPQTQTKEDKLKQEVQQVIENTVKEGKSKKKIALPTRIFNYDVSYYQNSSTGIPILFFFGFILGIGIYVAMDKDLEGKMKNRDQELLLDYPEIIMKFTLLLEAGLTIKNSWGRIVKEYKIKIEKGEEKKRYAYEEMMITWIQLGNGISEAVAFSKFGNRVGLMPYLRFSSMLSQNVKKGAKGLIELLEYEGQEAFENRKELARKQGEEASTKLLGPMMLILLMIIFLIMVPAFMLI